MRRKEEKGSRRKGRVERKRRGGVERKRRGGVKRKRRGGVERKSKGREVVEEKFERKIRGGVERKRRCGREGVTRIEEEGESLRETEEEKGWVARREDEGVAKERVVIEEKGLVRIMKRYCEVRGRGGVKPITYT